MIMDNNCVFKQFKKNNLERTRDKRNRSPKNPIEVSVIWLIEEVDIIAMIMQPQVFTTAIIPVSLDQV
jgi:hypothetical protein